MKTFIRAALLMLVCSIAAAEDEVTRTSRIVSFATGTATIETAGDIEHISIKELDGSLRAESTCDSNSTGSYEQIVAFKKSLQGKTDDSVAMSKIVRYPMRLSRPEGQGLRITDEKAFLQYAKRILTPAVIKAIQESEPHDVFCRNGMSMMGSGVLWMTLSESGQMKIAVVNQ